MWSDDPGASKKPIVTNIYPEICASDHASPSHAVTFSIRLTAVAVQEPFTPASPSTSGSHEEILVLKFSVDLKHVRAPHAPGIYLQNALQDTWRSPFSPHSIWYHVSGGQN